MRINKRIYDYIDYELSNYKDYKQKIENIRKNIIDSSPNPPDGLPRGNTTSDPTADKVIGLNTPMAIARMEFNKQCIDKAKDRLDKYHNQFFTKNYIENNGQNKIGVCYELSISERTYYRMKKKVIEYVGKEMGLI